MGDQPTMPARKHGHGGVVTGIGIDLTMAVLGGLIHHSGTQPAERAVVGDWGSIAFALIVATPGVLALLGLQRRPCVLAAAGMLLFPMCFLSFSFLFFPLAIPALLFLTDAISRPQDNHRPFAQCAAAVLSALFVVVATLSLWAHTDPITWSTPTGGGSASDVITKQEGLTSVGFLIAAVAVAALAPRDTQPTRR